MIGVGSSLQLDHLRLMLCWFHVCFALFSLQKYIPLMLSSGTQVTDSAAAAAAVVGFLSSLQ